MRCFDSNRQTLFSILTVVSLSIFGFACEPDVQAAQATTKADSTTMLVLGDSISAEYGLPRGTGWVKLLDGRLKDEQLKAGTLERSDPRVTDTSSSNQNKPHDLQLGPWAVVNASISGETTAGGRTRIDRLLAKHQPALVLIELGGNDALRGLDLTSSAKNLNHIAAQSRASGAEVVVLGMRVPPNYGRAYTERFAAIFTDVAKTHDAQLVPFLLSEIVGKESSFQADGIHPVREVQAVLLETAWPAIQAAIAKLGSKPPSD